MLKFFKKFKLLVMLLALFLLWSLAWIVCIASFWQYEMSGREMIQMFDDVYSPIETSIKNIVSLLKS